MRYEDWERNYPNHVVLMKEFGFYNGRGFSAAAIHDILNYKLFKDKFGRIGAGGPSLNKITEALHSRHMNYIAVAFDQILCEKTFHDSTFPRPYNNPEDCPDWYNRILRNAHEETIINETVPELEGKRILHTIPSYGWGTVEKAYYNNEGVLNIEIRFDNGRKANPFDYDKCMSKDLLKFADI